MHSFQNLQESYRRLGAILRELLNVEKAELRILDGIDYPLLILEMGSDIAGFAVLEAEPERAYARAYTAFKDTYRKNHNSWRDRNLSFVLCRPEDRRSDDAFFSKTETDVYFCRKYVITLRCRDAEQITELQRLPFVPLRDDKSSGVIRPPSARALLQRANLSAELARRIVEDYASSADRILKEELLPELNFDSQATPEILTQSQAVENTRVTDISIEAFRAYRKRQEFDLDADLVVLYGPNGLGKTSFFDAIDYVCTGRMGRFCSHHNIKPDRFFGFARHLDSSPEDGSVSLGIKRGDSTSSITRDLVDWNTVLLDGKRVNRRGDVLQFLTSAMWGEKRPLTANLECLFRATHLFSQSTPELLIAFEERSELPAGLVSRMLALDDYATGQKKTQAVLDLAKKKLADVAQDTAKLEEHINDIRSRIRKLPESPTGAEAPASFRRDAKKLASELEEHLDFAVSDDNSDPTAELARKWRAVVEASIQEVREMLHRTREVESGHPQFEKNSKALEDEKTKGPQMEAALEKRSAEQEKKRRQKLQLMSGVEKERSELTLATARMHALNDFAELREVYQEAINSLRLRRQELKLAIGKAQTTSDELRALAPTAESLRAQIVEQQKVNKTASAMMNKLAAIQEEFTAWERSTQQVANLQRRTGELETSASVINEKRVVLKAGIGEQEKKLAALDKEYELASADQTKLTLLLEEIETHVSSATCPVCGTDHASRVELIKRIHARKKAQPSHVEKLRSQRGKLRDALAEARSVLTEHSRERESKLTELSETTEALKHMCASISAYEHQVSEVGLIAGEDLQNILINQLAQTAETQTTAEQTQKRLESELGKVVERMTVLEQEEKTQAAICERSESSISSLERRIAALQTKANEIGVPLEIEAQELAGMLEAATSHAMVVRQRVEKAEKTIQEIARIINKETASVEELDEGVEAHRMEVERIESEIELYRERASIALGKRTDISLEAISQRRKHLEKHMELLQAIVGRCIALERTLDAAQRSAMLSDLELQVAVLIKQKQSLFDTSERLSRARDVFAGVKRILDRQISQAVANYVEGLGFLTTVIQKRLRAAYGFGDISLRAKGNEIQVSVGWNDQDLKPGDFFSDSQNQILMLSLFLSGRLTQTWSGFAPILMDDPVTHFDDLNAFGFVELIRGLASSYPGRRQFFISTCDDRLFGLMRSKFRDLPGGVRFYEFEGIGRDGPVVKRIDVHEDGETEEDSGRGTLAEGEDKGNREANSRTSGVSFSGPGDVTIHGDVVGGDQTKTH